MNAVIERGLHLPPPPALPYPIGISIKPSSTIKNTHASGFPLLSGIRDDLSDTLGVGGCSLCTRKGEGEQEDLGKAKHGKEHKGRWTVKQASGLERRKDSSTARRERQKRKKKTRQGDPGRIVHPYISLWPFVTDSRGAADLPEKYISQAWSLWSPPVRMVAKPRDLRARIRFFTRNHDEENMGWCTRGAGRSTLFPPLGVRITRGDR